jgi:hypothetical protein
MRYGDFPILVTSLHNTTADLSLPSRSAVAVNLPPSLLFEEIVKAGDAPKIQLRQRHFSTSFVRDEIIRLHHGLLAVLSYLFSYLL